MHADLAVGPVGHSVAGQFGSVVASQDGRVAATLGGDAVEFGAEVLAGDVALDQTTQALAGVFVDDGGDLDRAPVGGGVELEVHRPDPVGGISGRHVGGGRGAVTFTAAPLRNAQPFRTPKTLNLLVIDDPAFTAGIVVGRPETTARMVLGVLAQPVPQGGVRILRSARDRFVALGGAVLPGDAAGEPFADPQYPLEVVNSRPPATRA